MPGLILMLAATVMCTGDEIESVGTQVKGLKDAVLLFQVKYGRHPDAQEGLEALLAPPRGGRPLIDAVPIDPWGRRLVYRAPTPGCRFEVYSLGPDGMDGTYDDYGRRSIAAISETDCLPPLPE